ncbi:hypothetical protein BSKO_11260 [Bryopsis sp. KO-2023]|nr:hypothetical protein BSKO_11260 [Bryopsis sp. KO-2023]
MRASVAVVVLLAFMCAGCFGKKKEEIPPECIASSSSLLTTCVEEINTATEFFGVKPDDPSTFENLVINDELINGLLEELGDPTPGCCKGTCEFVNDYCGCNKPMIKLIDGFVAGNFQFFRTVSESIGSKCGIPTYYEENCPKNAWEKTWKKFAPGNCTQFE